MKKMFIIYLFLATAAYTQVGGTLQGTVTDAGTGELLPGANIFVEKTFVGASTGEQGRYNLHIQPGTYTIKASFIGYATGSATVTIRPNQTIDQNFALEPTTLQSEQIIVTGSRQPEKLASAASSINVLGRREIERRNSFRIEDALLMVPGVSIVGDYINIRGGSGYNRLGGSRSLVLLDGVPILTSDLGTANWNILPVTEIEHIEVLKGAASSLYGSGALSGVINMFTKLPSDELTVAFKQSAGIYDEPSVEQWKWTDETLYYYRTDVSLSNSYGPVGLRLAMSHHESTGDRENGYFKRWYFTGKSHIRLSKQSSITLFGTYSRDDRELFLQWQEQDHALQVPPTELGNRYKIDGFVGYAVYNKLFSPTLSTKVRLSYNQQLVGIPFNISSAFTPALGASGEAQINWKPHPNHSLSMGVDYKYDEVESKYYGKRYANGISPYIQEIWQVNNLLQLNTGLRLDTYTLVGDSVEWQLSPKIGASYQPWFGTVFHGSWGMGFRAATVVERFITAGSSDFRAKPNPDLMPERSKLFDLGIRQNIRDNAYAEVTLFYNDYKNFIEPTLFADLTAQFLNYPRARIWGVETEFRWQLWHDRVRLGASFTWMEPRNLETKEPLLNRNQFMGFLTPGFYYGPFFMEVDYRFMSPVEKWAVYPLDEKVPTKVWDVRLNYKYEPLSFQLQIKNALNYNYTVSDRVLGEIRSFMFTISGEF